MREPSEGSISVHHPYLERGGAHMSDSTSRSWSGPTKILREVGLSPTDLANHAGMTQPYVSLVFTGRYTWSKAIESALVTYTGDPAIVAAIKTAQAEERRDFLLREIADTAAAVSS